jgi:hypothetical protein
MDVNKTMGFCTPKKHHSWHGKFKRGENKGVSKTIIADTKTRRDQIHHVKKYTQRQYQPNKQQQ